MVLWCYLSVVWQAVCVHSFSLERQGNIPVSVVTKKRRWIAFRDFQPRYSSLNNGCYPPSLCRSVRKEGRDRRGKMGFDIGRFLPWENGIYVSGTGIRSLGMGIKCTNSTSGSGICALESGILKKNGLGNGIGAPAPSLFRTLRKQRESIVIILLNMVHSFV